MTKASLFPSLVWTATAIGASFVLVTAFSAGDTGARTVTASVVTDANSYLAITANGASPHYAFVSVSSGVTSVTFDGNGNATGTGINPDSTYEFDAILNITNQGTGSVDVDITIGGTDSSLCFVALTSTTTQASNDYSADPTALSLTTGSTGHLGLRVDGDSKTSGQSVSCTITVTAARP